MRDFHVPSFGSVAFAGAAWLAGIAILLVIPFSGFTSLGDLIVRELLGGAMLLAAGYLFKAGLSESETEHRTRVLAREAIRRMERTRRAA